MKKRFLFTATILAAGIVCAAPGHRVAGSGVGGNSPYATDAYPGFDGLDDLPKPERREKSWFLHVARDTPIEQFAYAKELAENNDLTKQLDSTMKTAVEKDKQIESDIKKIAAAVECR